MIEAEKAEESKSGLVSGAFTAWLLGADGSGKSFNGFLYSLGLAEKEKPMKPEQKKALCFHEVPCAHSIEVDA